MKETRKQLIELLEPYMEKDFGNKYEKNYGKGILIQEITYKHNRDKADEKIYGKIIELLGQDFEFDGEKFHINNFYYKEDRGKDYPNIYHNQIKLKNINFDYKIIGHYDLSAVLKYIKGKGGFNDRVEMGEKEILFKVRGDIEGLIYKPLHLYTQEEETILLKLLKYLGKN